jgi:acyl CoA:acetate/3-ketoacid CoA transferase alpha subunit
MSDAKRIAESIVREWMLRPATERKMDALVAAIEEELNRAFANGMRAGAASIANLREEREGR